MFFNDDHFDKIPFQNLLSQNLKFACIFGFGSDCGVIYWGIDFDCQITFDPSIDLIVLFYQFTCVFLVIHVYFSLLLCIVGC
jgi:hypothetical protein